MGFPSGPTFTNVFLCYHEKVWLQNCPSELNLLSIEDMVIKKLRNYLNRQHTQKKENCISFLDIKITRGNNKFITSVYYKPTFSEVFTNFGSFIMKLTCCLRYYTGHSNFAQILSVFIKKLTSFRLFLKITVIAKVLSISVSKST